MTGYLLDTNVISELSKDAPDPRVIRFLGEQVDIWLSSILIHEVEYGLQLLPQGRRRNRLFAMQSGILADYSNRVLPLDRPAAEWAARFRARVLRAGRTIDLGDILIAGIARANELAVATRNAKDFAGLDLEVMNPWEYQ